MSRVPPWSHLAGVGAACFMVLCPVMHGTYFFLSQPHPPVTPLGSSGTWPSPAWVFLFQSAQRLGTPFPVFLPGASSFLRDPHPSWRDSHGTSSCCRNSSLFRFFFSNGNLLCIQTHASCSDLSPFAFAFCLKASWETQGCSRGTADAPEPQNHAGRPGRVMRI